MCLKSSDRVFFSRGKRVFVSSSQLKNPARHQTPKIPLSGGGLAWFHCRFDRDDNNVVAARLQPNVVGPDFSFSDPIAIRFGLI